MGYTLMLFVNFSLEKCFKIRNCSIYNTGVSLAVVVANMGYNKYSVKATTSAPSIILHYTVQLVREVRKEKGYINSREKDGHSVSQTFRSPPLPYSSTSCSFAMMAHKGSRWLLARIVDLPQHLSHRGVLPWGAFHGSCGSSGGHLR